MIILYIIIVVLAFITGCLLGRYSGRDIKLSANNNKSINNETWVRKQESEEEKAAMETEKAFADLLGYNADIAYGIKK
jgi:hypothetical protein